MPNEAHHIIIILSLTGEDGVYFGVHENIMEILCNTIMN